MLEHWRLWGLLRERLVSGENAAQTLQFVATGNAEAGLVALAQLLALPAGSRGAYRLIAEDLHDPIDQQALLLRDNAPARAFLDYLRSDEAAAVIQGAGYAVPARP